MKNLVASVTNPNIDASLGLLIHRVAFSVLMIAGHGWGKLTGGVPADGQFPDPLGVGTQLSWGLAVTGEVFAPILVALGLFSRLSAIPTLITMLVAAFIVHGPHPFFAAGGPNKEFAFVYAMGYLAIVLMGGGKYSLDGLIARKRDELRPV